MCKISIIVPVYNVEKYLKRCIESILNQTFNNFELILVNDGSTDNSLQICNSYLEKDSRIKLINKVNGGLSSARNKGLENAKGKYIAFIDSDDYIHKDMFQILYNNLIKYSADISMCEYKNIYDNTKNEFNKILSEDNNIKQYFNKDALKELYEDNKVTMTVAWNKLYNIKLFENISYEFGKFHEDEFIIHKLLYRCKKIVYTKQQLYFYTQREGSIMQDTFKISRLDGLEAIYNRIIFYNKINEKELRQNTEYQYVNLFFRYYYKAKMNLNNTHNVEMKLNIMKKTFINLFPKTIKNPKYTTKEKFTWILFIINPNIYYRYNKKRGRII